MKPLNISKILIDKRHEKGLTQESVAKYFGVSKASVSKWETGQSYPDILLLPEIAAFYNISIDELFGYSPQLSSTEIKAIYEEFGHRYQIEEFEHLIKEIDQKIRKYYACHPFILAMAQWFLNYGILNKDEKTKDEMLEYSFNLSNHVIDSSNDSFLMSVAESFIAFILMHQKKYDECFNILGKDPKVATDAMHNDLLLKIYMALGDIDKSTQISQVNIFQSVNDLLNSLLSYQSLNLSNRIQHDLIYKQIITLIDLFDLHKNGSNALFITHLIAAQSNILHNDFESAIDKLNHYYNAVNKIVYPLIINRNEYFNLINDWIENNFHIGNMSPTTEEQIKSNIVDSVKSNPAFTVLQAMPEFQDIIHKLEHQL